jgi:hypothetical protein
MNDGSHALGTFADYFAAGCDAVAAEINAQIAARHPFNTASYLRCFGRLPNYAEPRGYTEKIQWRKMFDRNPLFVTWCDKLQAREFARTRAPDLRFAELLWAGDDPDAMPLEDIRPPFVVKPNNRSASIKRVRDAGDLDQAAIREECRAWLRLPPYGLNFNEWAYARSETRFLVERMLSGSRAPTSPIDFKLHVFSGKTRMIYRCDARAEERGMYSPTWELLRLDRWLWGRLDLFDGDHAPPENLERMVAIAEALAVGTDYVRVDLYNIDGEIFFGELTPFPSSGFAYFLKKGTECSPYPPRGPDDAFGEHWTLPDISWPTRMQNALIE